MKLKIALAAAIMSLTAAAPAYAQAGVEALGTRSEGHWGGDVGIGYSAGKAGFKITPIVGAFVYQSDNARYYMDANGGSPRCRDSTNGQYADRSNCFNWKAKPYGKLEATYSIPLVARVGVGVRVSDDVRPYGTAAFALAPKIRLKVDGGPHYVAGGLTLGF